MIRHDFQNLTLPADMAQVRTYPVHAVRAVPVPMPPHHLYASTMSTLFLVAALVVAASELVRRIGAGPGMTRLRIVP